MLLELAADPAVTPGAHELDHRAQLTPRLGQFVARPAIRFAGALADTGLAGLPQAAREQGRRDHGKAALEVVEAAAADNELAHEDIMMVLDRHRIGEQSKKDVLAIA